MKWLALAGVAALVGALLLWHSLRGGSAHPPDAAAAPAVAPGAPGRPAPTRPAPQLPEHPVVEGPIGAIERDEPDEDAPIPVDSDEFYEVLDEVYSRRLTGITHDCYQGGLPPKAKLRLLFRWEIKGGEVSVHDVKVDESTLGAPKVEACMVKAVAAAHWRDPRMPDWATRVGEEERVLIRIENLKRFDPPKD